MANNLFITYDLIKTKDYSAVHKVIKELGDWAKITESNWYLNCNLNSKEAAIKIRSAMDNDDKLIVVDATNNSFWSFNISSTATDFMKNSWVE